MKVRKLNIREIFATNSEKTIEVELQTVKGIVRSSVPIGTSRSKYEVRYLPVTDVIRKFLLIRRQFVQDFANQEEVDNSLRTIDNSVDFRDIGGNLALAVSSAFLRAFALENDQEVFEMLGKPAMPKPICNVLGGWKGTSDIQEFLLLPLHQKSFRDSMTKIIQAYLQLGSKLREKDPSFAYAKNMESGWVSSLDLYESLDILKNVANEYLMKIGLDFAASQLWNGEHYVYKRLGKKFSRPEQISLVEDLTRKYPILYIEDPFHEDDFLAFSVLNHRLKQRILCGDDIFSTNPARLKAGIEEKVANAMIIKPNQVGTITDVVNTIKEADKNSLITVMSHRSGETEDNLICHLAVGLGCDYIKIGASGERTVKINEMMRIEEKIKG
jgi:enolase